MLEIDDTYGVFSDANMEGLHFNQGYRVTAFLKCNLNRENCVPFISLSISFEQFCFSGFNLNHHRVIVQLSLKFPPS